VRSKPQPQQNNLKDPSEIALDDNRYLSTEFNQKDAFFLKVFKCPNEKEIERTACLSDKDYDNPFWEEDEVTIFIYKFRLWMTK